MKKNRGNQGKQFFEKTNKFDNFVARLWKKSEDTNCQIRNEKLISIKILWILKRQWDYYKKMYFSYRFDELMDKMCILKDAQPKVTLEEIDYY